MDAVGALAERAAVAPCAHRQDLREDRDRRLGRRLGADVEAYRAMDAVDGAFVEAELEQRLAPPGLGLPRPVRAPYEGVVRTGVFERGVVYPFLGL